jgi:hypothetical protein
MNSATNRPASKPTNDTTCSGCSWNRPTGELEYVYDGTWSRFRLRLQMANGLPLERASREEAEHHPVTNTTNVA